LPIKKPKGVCVGIDATSNYPPHTQSEQRIGSVSHNSSRVAIGIEDAPLIGSKLPSVERA
jgi:hypothetical protein